MIKETKMLLNKMPNKIFSKTWWINIALIVIGSLIAAFSINMFLVPYKIIEGGVTGIAIILYYISEEGLPVGLTTFIMTLPLFITGFYKLGKSTSFNSIIATILLSLFIDTTSSISKTIIYKYFISPEKIMEYPLIMLYYCVISGISLGTGYGIIYITGASTGGSDLAAMIIKKYLPKVTIGTMIMLFDGMVVILSGIVFKSAKITFYAVFRVFVTTVIVDIILKHRKNRVVAGTKVNGCFFNCKT